MEEGQKAQIVDIEKIQGSPVGEVEMPKIDVTQYIGKDVQIVSVQEKKGKHGYFVEVKTEVVETIEREGQDNILLCGQKNLGLTIDEKGVIGIGIGSKTHGYLKKMKVESYKDLLGVTVKLQTQDKNDKEFLTF